ncbi:phosphodiester glycosidase family protein [Roseateles sp. BYS78W]|uniref:Phosphodiester glycosidase family protein n=1 Tax=Pelomonas candidula TaxID=3299025 RepID=A0ABW7H8R6_9BURK
MKRRLFALALAFAGFAAKAQGNGLFTVVRVDVARLELFWQDDKGQPLRRLDRLAAWQKAQGKTLTFGMNAGMYHADAAPVGLLVIDGRELSPLNLADGQGNFFLKPNGVFFIDATGAHVADAADYAAAAHDGVRLATQSGPLLLKHGQIHPAFRPSSASRYIRNGVCAQGGQVVFVISERPVTFHEFASFFLDELHCQDALYLDGAVSSLWSPRLGRNDHLHELGPLFGVTESGQR